MKKVITFCLLLLLAGTMSAQKSTDRKGEDGKVNVISQEDFKKKVFDYDDTTALYRGKKPIVVDFYADWCGPCRRLGVVMEEVVKKYDGEVIFYKINVDNNKEIAQAFGIQSIPMVLYIKPKERPRSSVGLLTKGQLEEIIDEILLDKAKNN